MPKINPEIIKLDEENIFSKVIQKVNEYKKKHPTDDIVSLGVGDVTRPIVEPVALAMHRAVDDLSKEETFKGYNGDGYDFLKEKIIENEYHDYGFANEEIHISNGTKTDCTSILELFPMSAKIGVTNAMYPVYRDGARCLGRKVYFLDAKEENNFIPDIPKEKYDLIYICSPSNPVGNAYTYQELKKWVDYAINNQAVILYDNVYSAFISSEDVPKSIYEIDEAKQVAIEMNSYSKVASFTGVRCSYYVIPKEIYPDVNRLWRKRISNRFNGTDYIAQRGAEAVYLPESQKLIKENIAYYKENIKMLKDFFTSYGFKVYGGIDSPYIWVKNKENMGSWDLFNLYLNKLNIVIIPGIIFGKRGEKYFRVSGFATRDNINKAIERMKKYYGKEK